jgi:hypothetical protein
MTISLVLFWRIRTFGRWGSIRFSLSVATFLIWTAAVLGVSSASGWMGTDQPGAHTTVSFAVAALPLLLAAWLIGRGRR